MLVAVLDIPITPVNIAVLSAVLNLVIPGSGTILATCNNTTQQRSYSQVQIIIGVLQFLLSLIIIGYIWSLVWSYFIVVKSVNGTSQTPTNSALSRRQGYLPVNNNA